MKVVCPITGCLTLLKSKEDIIKHFMEQHPEIDEIKLGKEVIKIRGEQEWN